MFIQQKLYFINMKLFTVFIISELSVLSAMFIKQLSAHSLSDLCSFRKSSNKCLCYFKTSTDTHFPMLHADCTRMTMDKFPHDSQLKKVEYLDLSHNAIFQLDLYENNFESAKMFSLKLAFNRIVYVAQDFFRNMPNLTKLDLSHNDIVNFASANIFRGLNKLKALDLSFNMIPTLPEDIFASMPNLRELDLGHNYLGMLLMYSRNLFNSTLRLSPEVTTLKLDALGIGQLHNNFFIGAKNLKYLSLANNPFGEVPSVPYTLDYLDLSGTDISTLSARHLNYHSLKVLKVNRLKKLTSIEHYAFYNLQALEELHISDCKNLREFTDLAFGILENEMEWSLKRIYLARSGLRSLNSTYLRLFNKLERADLQGNPWVCNCDIFWLQQVNISLSKNDNIRCISPIYVLNKKVLELTEKDMPSCAEKNNHVQKVLISILAGLVAILVILIIYLIYLGPFYHQNKYRGIGPQSPYQSNTIRIIPTRAESLD